MTICFICRYYLRQWNEGNWRRLWDWSICPFECLSVCTRIGTVLG